MRWKSLPFLAIVFTLFATLVAADATYPQWWLDYEIVPSQPPDSSLDPTGYNAWMQDNLAVPNLGQLKYVAAQTTAYLDDKLAAVGGAGPEIDSLVAAFQTDSANTTVAVNLGQLKHLAKPFYDRLVAIGFNTTADLNLRLGGNATNITWTEPYPWLPGTSGNENLSLANLGQIKFVFTFDVGTPELSGVDADSDGLPDVWEVAHGLSPFSTSGDNGAGGDPDGDGITNAGEYSHGTNPQNADEDADGITDGWEIDYFGNLSQGPNDDPDGDGLTNKDEFDLGTDPTVDDRASKLSYAYDANGRLLSASGTGISLSYEYDAEDNMKEVDNP